MKKGFRRPVGNESRIVIGLLAAMTATLAPTPPGRRGVTARPPAEKCDLDAYVVDPDPHGLNVRSGPGRNFPVLGRLPGVGNTTVSIRGSTGEWVLIDGAQTLSETEKEIPDTKIRGWVYGPMLATGARYAGGSKFLVKVFSAPRHGASVVATVDQDTQVSITGCHEKWVHIRYKKVKGWLDSESQCPNPVTTCP